MVFSLSSNATVTTEGSWHQLVESSNRSRLLCTELPRGAPLGQVDKDVDKARSGCCDISHFPSTANREASLLLLLPPKHRQA